MLFSQDPIIIEYRQYKLKEHNFLQYFLVFFLLTGTYKVFDEPLTNVVTPGFLRSLKCIMYKIWKKSLC